MKRSATLFVVLVSATVGCGGGSSGDRIVFGSGSVYDSDGTFYDSEIFVMNADGTEVRQLTDNDDGDFEPSWSPDGKRIAFSSWRVGDSEIFVMNADGTKVRQLTDNDGSAPSWSPNGKHIAFSSERDGDFEIFVMNADGTEVRQLTDNDEINRFPSWSPNGEHIAFTSGNLAYQEIFVMNADGTNTYSTGQHGSTVSFGG